jgi:NAD-dependent dihydropyrimidine dehydrogenase PreA subunit
MTYVIAEPCIEVQDKACIEECPYDAIYPGLSMSYIHPGVCQDCGACEPVCPVEAIYYEDDVPVNWTRFVGAAQDFASRVPGGGSGGLEYGFDSPLIFMPGNDDTAPVSTGPNPFFYDQAGTRIAVLWDREISLDMIKALLLVFDKVALIGSGARVDAHASNGDQWQVLIEMGLVAQVSIADAVAVIDTESVRALFGILLARKPNKATQGREWQKSVLWGAFRRLGEPDETVARAVPYDAVMLEAASTVICWMFEESVAACGVSVYDFTTQRATVDAFTRVAARFIPAARMVSLPCEWVLPPCGEASVEQLLDFRTAAGPSYRRYLDCLMDAMTSLSRRPDAAMPTSIYSPDEVADEVYRLRRLIRDLPWLGRGYIGLGLIGNAGLPRLRDAEDVAQTVGALRATQQAHVRPRALFVGEPARSSWI